MAGQANGTLPGHVVGEAAGVFSNAQVDSSGFFNFFVRKYDLDGNEQWTSQFGPGQHMRAAAADIPVLLTIGGKISNTVTIPVAH